MFKLNEETKKNISKIIGIPYEKLITMDDDEITAFIEKKNGEKLKYGKVKITGSGDDSVLIDQGKFRTMEKVDEKIMKIIKKCKSKKNKKDNELSK